MKVRIRMYRQGLGDCFLLTFGDQQDEKHILIDCGSLGATTTRVKMEKVAQSILDTTAGHLDLLIATHEHKDHVSGFLTEQEIFDQIEVDHVWLAWTENAEDDVAQDLKKHQGDLITAAKLAAAALSGCDADDDPERDAAHASGDGIRRVLAFYDEDGPGLGARFAKTVHAAMTYVTRKAPGKPSFLEPDDDPIEPDWLPGVRFYVLGPPRDEQALGNLGHHGAPELYALAADRANDLTAGIGFFAADEPLDSYYDQLEVTERRDLDRLLPFDTRHRLEDRDEEVKKRCGGAYYDPKAAWRRIDFDWLSGSSNLALQLDGRTNNTSLALAIELVEDGRVLLFPADAQLGNWLSWHQRLDENGEPHTPTWRVTHNDGSEQEVTAADLLCRTVFYKAGHHASHNATIREQGLELMNGEGLTTMIPVDRKLAMNKRPKWQMPARALYRRLIEKAEGRVLRSDTGWATRDDPDFGTLFSDADWQAWEESQEGTSVEIDELFIDYYP